jgi:hypothetical protein
MLSNNETILFTTLAAAGGAVMTGIVTAVVTYKVTRRQVTSAESVAEKQREHELAVEEEKRRQERIYDAYVTVTRFIDYQTAVITWKLRDMRYRTDPPAEPPTTDEGIGAEAQAVASLVASAAVAVRVASFNKALVAYRTSLATYDQATEWLQQSGTIPADDHFFRVQREGGQRLYAAGEDALDKGEALLNQMRSELGSEGALPSDTSGMPDK